MKDILTEIIEDSKLALKESIIIENKIIEDKLLSILTNTKLLEQYLEKNNLLKKAKKLTSEELKEKEIEKIKRKLPLWLEKQNQYSFKILKAFMDLSNNGKFAINLISLERYVNFNDSKKFLAHYNQLKTISAKNHGKIFEENNQQITLWEPVEEFLIKEYLNTKIRY